MPCTDRELMELAVSLANGCDPKEPERTPRLGVVIAIDGRIIATAIRGTGEEHDDDHAELKALKIVGASEDLTRATGGPGGA